MTRRSGICDRARTRTLTASAPAGRAPATHPASGVVEQFDLFPYDIDDSLNDELCDAVAPVYVERLVWVEVDEQHAYLVTEPGVDQPGRIEARDAVPQGEAAGLIWTRKAMGARSCSAVMSA